MLTGAQVAERLGINPSRVRQIGTKLGLGTKYGKTWVYTDEEVKIMEARKTTPGPVKASAIFDEPAQTPYHLTLDLPALAEYIVGLGMVTDNILGAQTVVIGRVVYDRFAELVDAATGDDPITVAARALVAAADVHDTTVDVPVAVFSALDRALA